MIEELTMEKAIDFAVETEKLGEHTYRRLANRFRDDNELNKLFSTLAEDEKYHAQRFDQLREQAAGTKLSDADKEYLRAVSISEIFSGPEAVGKDVDEITDRETALQRAFRLERTTLSYYKAMRDVIESPLLDEMIAEEKSHLQQVVKYMVTGAEMRGLGDKF